MHESKYRTIFWTSCVAHCIDLMLEHIGKVELVKNIVEHAKCITKYIYNHSLVLSLMRKTLGAKSLLGLELRDLQFTSSRCNVSILNRKTCRIIFLLMIGLNLGGLIDKMAKTPKKKVFANYFWKRSAELVKIIGPLVKVLRMFDGENLAMGYIYEAMDQAKEQIRAAYKDKLAKYGRLWEIIDNRWNNQLHRPIHAAGYFLKAKYHYKARLGELQDGDVRVGLIDCLEHTVLIHVDQLEIHKQLTLFSVAAGSFGKNMTKMARDVDQPSINSVFVFIFKLNCL